MGQYHRNIVAVLASALLVALVAFAVDQKVTELTEETSPATTDLLYLVIDPGTSPASRKAQIDTVLAVPHGTGSLRFGFDGGGSALTAGTYYNAAVRLPWDVTLTSWQLVAPESGTAVLGLAKCTYATWPTATSILGAQSLAVTASSVAQDLDIANWGETLLTAGDILIPTITSATETGLVLNLNFSRR